MHSRNLITFGKLKDKALGVVVVILSFLELQVDEALVAAGECTLVQLLGLLLRGGGVSAGRGLVAEEGVATETCCDGETTYNVRRRGRAALGGFSRIRADALRSISRKLIIASRMFVPDEQSPHISKQI